MLRAATKPEGAVHSVLVCLASLPPLLHFRRVIGGGGGVVGVLLAVVWRLLLLLVVVVVMVLVMVMLLVTFVPDADRRSSPLSITVMCLRLQHTPRVFWKYNGN